MSQNIVNVDKIGQIKTELSTSINDLPKIYTLLQNITESDYVEIFFYNEDDSNFFETVKYSKIETKYLDANSFLGRAFHEQKPFVSQNIENNGWPRRSPNKNLDTKKS